MTWTLTEKIAPETLIEFEAKVNQFVSDHDVRALCQYRRHRFSPELILGIIRTHPVVVLWRHDLQEPLLRPSRRIAEAQSGRAGGRKLDRGSVYTRGRAARES